MPEAGELKETFELNAFSVLFGRRHILLILFAFFRKSLGEFFAAYSADIYGDEKGPEDRDGGLANSVLYGFNITLILGVLILIAFWILLTKGVRL